MKWSYFYDNYEDWDDAKKLQCFKTVDKSYTKDDLVEVACSFSTAANASAFVAGLVRQGVAFDQSQIEELVDHVDSATLELLLTNGKSKLKLSDLADLAGSVDSGLIAGLLKTVDLVSAKSVYNAVVDIGDEKQCEILVARAIDEGLRFTSDQVIELSSYVGKDTTYRLAKSHIAKLSIETLQELQNISDADIKRLLASNSNNATSHAGVVETHNVSVISNVGGVGVVETGNGGNAKSGGAGASIAAPFTWEEFFRKLMNNEYQQKDGDAIFDVKRLAGLGPADELVTASKRLGYEAGPYLTRLIVEKRPNLTPAQVFAIWDANNYRDYDSATKLLIAYGVDIRTNKSYIESASTGHIGEEYFQYMYRQIHHSTAGYKVGWRPKEVKKSFKKLQREYKAQEAKSAPAPVYRATSARRSANQSANCDDCCCCSGHFCTDCCGNCFQNNSDCCLCCAGCCGCCSEFYKTSGKSGSGRGRRRW